MFHCIACNYYFSFSRMGNWGGEIYFAPSNVEIQGSQAIHVILEGGGVIICFVYLCKKWNEQKYKTRRNMKIVPFNFLSKLAHVVLLRVKCTCGIKKIWSLLSVRVTPLRVTSAVDVVGPSVSGISLLTIY